MSTHSPNVAHQFQDAVQQKETDVVGMWVFLATEVLFFGALFASFYFMRSQNPDAFLLGARHMQFWLGTANTFILLFSSLAVVFAVHHASHGNAKGIARWLGVTILLGVGFLCVKGFEYHAEYEEHLIPGLGFEFRLDDPADKETQELLKSEPEVARRLAAMDPGQLAGRVKLFFVFYFCMTGLHALHMIIGIGVMSVLILKTRRGRYTAAYHNPIEIAGLYWHFVDIVWVFLFPTLYLLLH